jgi:hypothetical protein
VKPCPECGGSLHRSRQRKWYCSKGNCPVQYVLLNKDGSIKETVYVTQLGLQRIDVCMFLAAFERA